MGERGRGDAVLLVTWFRSFTSVSVSVTSLCLAFYLMILKRVFFLFVENIF